MPMKPLKNTAMIATKIPNIVIDWSNILFVRCATLSNRSAAASDFLLALQQSLTILLAACASS